MNGRWSVHSQMTDQRAMDVLYLQGFDGWNGEQRSQTLAQNHLFSFLLVVGREVSGTTVRDYILRVGSRFCLSFGEVAWID